MLQPLPITTSSSTLISAFLSTLVTPSTTPSGPSLKSPAVPLPKTFQSLANPLPTTLPAYLSDLLDVHTLYNHENNNVAFLSRQIGREKAKHEGLVREREEENLRRKKQGLAELPSLPVEARGGTKEPSRLELMCLQGQVEGIAKGMGAEASAGLVRCYL
jgi:translation initiation factor 3 subunit H